MNDENKRFCSDALQLAWGMRLNAPTGLRQRGIPRVPGLAYALALPGAVDCADGP